MSRIEELWPLSGHADLRDRLLTAYDEPHRAYHGRTHLTEVLERVERILADDRTPGVHRDAVLLAAWFHDAVYETSGIAPLSNEERSAALAESELTTAGVPAPLVAEVVRLVRLTEEHQPTEGDTAGQVLCDADLGILAADGNRYDEYAAAVRREYGHVPQDAFRVGRAQVLRRLVAGPSLFATPYAREHWEETARRNVERELARLER